MKPVNRVHNKNVNIETMSEWKNLNKNVIIEAMS